MDWSFYTTVSYKLSAISHAVAGSTDDNASSAVVLAVLDSVLRRHGDHATADAQFPARVAVSVHDAHHSLGGLPQQLPQSTYLRRPQQQLSPRFQAGALLRMQYTLY